MNGIKTPEACMHAICNKITKAERAAFLGAIIVGVVTHIYVLTNKLYNYDELPNTPSGFGVGIQNNRWFLELMGKVTARLFTGSYSLPVLNGVLSILLLAASAVLIVRMFQLKNTIFGFCVGGLMLAFPAVTCMFFFMFTAVYYAGGIFLSVLAAYLCVRHPRSIRYNAAAVVITACALGIYQAYFPGTVSLLLISVILLLAFDEETSPKNILTLCLRYVAVLLAGVIVYFCMNQVFRIYWNVDATMGTYQGMDTMGQLSLTDIVGGIQKCYTSFLTLSIGNVMYLNNSVMVQKCFGILMLLTLISVVILLVRKKTAWINKVFLVICFLLLPVALFMIYIMAPKAWSYTLMMYPVVFLLVLFFVFAERFSLLGFVQRNMAAIWQWGTLAASAVILVVYIWYGNGCYMALEYTKYHDLAYFETMITQIKSLDGYTDDMPVAIIGSNIEDQTNQAGSLLGQTFLMDGKVDSNVDGTSGLYIMTRMLGFTPSMCGYDETRAWMERREVAEMPNYPDDGSIQVIDGTIIVKLSDYELD